MWLLSLLVTDNNSSTALTLPDLLVNIEALDCHKTPGFTVRWCAFMLTTIVCTDTDRGYEYTIEGIISWKLPARLRAPSRL